MSVGAKTREPVSVTLGELAAGTVALSSLEEAFGPSSLGIIVVKGLDGRFSELRRRVLSYSSYLANLPRDELEKLENPQAKYLTGWSLGKETLKSGRYDTLKGSYYINSVFAGGQRPVADPADVAARYPNLPEYTAPNVWPQSEVLPGFREACEELCALIVDVAVLVARACDRFAEEHVEGYEKGGFLERIVRSSMSTKARLLHYFPTPAASAPEANGVAAGHRAVEDDDNDDWCATHVDHGCLTGLTSAMFVDETAQPPHAPPSTSTQPGAPPPPLEELASSPDPSAGLHIVTRQGERAQVRIPRDCLAFQTGEALELMTRGRFKAVPHFVRGVSAAAARANGGRSIARNTLAVFTQPNLWEIVDRDRGMDFAAFAKEVVARTY